MHQTISKSIIEVRANVIRLAKLRSLSLASFLALPLSFALAFSLAFSLALSCCAIFATQAFGQTSSDAKRTDSSAGASARKGTKRTTVNFEDQLIEGQVQKPELFYLLQQRNSNLKRLIKLRENFLPEMRKTSEDMNRKGSGN